MNANYTDNNPALGALYGAHLETVKARHDHALEQAGARHAVIFSGSPKLTFLDDYYHPYRAVPAYFLGVYEDNDPAKRLMIVANYNNDIGESWEFSDTGFIPIEISNVAYKLGVNYVVYAMTH